MDKKTFEELYRERAELYVAAADVKVNPVDQEPQELIETIYRACMVK